MDLGQHCRVPNNDPATGSTFVMDTHRINESEEQAME